MRYFPMLKEGKEIYVTYWYYLERRCPITGQGRVAAAEIGHNIDFELLQSAFNDGIINSIIGDVYEEIVRKQTRSYVEKHHNFSIKPITEHRKDGDVTRYRTFLPDENGKRGKAITRMSEDELYKALDDFYRARDKSKIATFGDVYSEWVYEHHRENNSSPNTIDKYKTDYLRFIKGKPLESMPITEITDKHLKDFFYDTIYEYVGIKGQKGLLYKPFGKIYGYVEGVFQYAIENKLITYNPLQTIPKKRFRQACRSVEEKTADTELIPDDKFNALLEQVYKDMEKHPTNFTFFAVELSAKTALRVGEVATLKWSDINWEEGYIHIQRSDKYNKVRDEEGHIIDRFWTVEETKTKKGRLFPLDECIIKSLKRIRRNQMEYGCASEWVFPHPEYGWTHSNLISSCIKNKCIQLGFDRTYGIHAFRKTLNSDMRKNGISAVICSGMLGHSVEVNNQYYTYDGSSLDEKAAAVNMAHSRRAFQ